MFPHLNPLPWIVFSFIQYASHLIRGAHLFAHSLPSSLHLFSNSPLLANSRRRLFSIRAPLSLAILLCLSFTPLFQHVWSPRIHKESPRLHRRLIMAIVCAGFSILQFSVHEKECLPILSVTPSTPRIYLHTVSVFFCPMIPC